MSAIEIEKGIPVPPARPAGKGGRESKYPFESMDVGDSFLVPANIAPADGDFSALRRLRLNLMTRCTKAGKRWGRRYTTRMVPEGVRVWRIE